eukprot:Gb_25355 [translate_table: standard]
MEEEIYMHQSKGCVQVGKEHLVCKLPKALYGPKQSSRVWYQRIDNNLIEEGFQHCSADLGVYIKRIGKSVLILALYVNNILVMSRDLSLVDAFKLKLGAEFEMTDHGEIHYCLGIQVQGDRKNRLIHLTKHVY